MSLDLPINANICEVNGLYYPVRLAWLPRPGDLIDLYSYLEAAAKRPDVKRYYEVVQVVHELRDIAEKVQQSHHGYHFVTVHVKPSQSSFFALGEELSKRDEPSAN